MANETARLDLDGRLPRRHAGAGQAARILIYSHDTFGLGHVRRTREIANALVAADPDISVVILSGSPVIGNFEFGDGIDYVRVPGVVKLPNGDYTSQNLNVGLDEAVCLREAIIRQTAETFRPDLLIVDKEPTGFRGEVVSALDLLKARGCRLVLGLRDVIDEPGLLVPEWERKGAVEALERYYDEIWVYGLREFYEPLRGLRLPRPVERRIVYTGYLRRTLPKEPHLARYPKLTREPFVLVMTGGGGDGEDLIDWVLSAYESDPNLTLPALIVFGPFLGREQRRNFWDRIRRFRHIDAILFDAKIEFLQDRAAGIVSMGGYNTFCEILSLDKPAVIVPRTRPRLEQYIRAERAERLGLVRMLVDKTPRTGRPRDPAVMAEALRGLLHQPRPSAALMPGLLDGLDRIQALTETALGAARRPSIGRYLGYAAE
jgi:predicted glycosyltransferase